MDNGFTITVEFRGSECSFEGQVLPMGYTHKICVFINNLEVMYEPDEERNYRALLNEADQSKVRQADMELIALVGNDIAAVR